MAYVTPVHYYPTRERRLRLIVIHTMESPEHDDTAENVAGWFAGRSGTAPLASAHACIDNNSVVLCLPPSATAWAAPGANADGYQIEQAGRAAQGIAGWADTYSQSMLRLSAAHARSVAQAAGIPLRHLTDAQLAAGAAGFVGHDQVSRVYKKSNHTDPGPDFPWTQYMSLVNGGSTPSTDTSEEDTDMQIVTTTANKGQWLLTGDGTLVGMPNTEYVRVAQKMVTGQLHGINAREVDVLKDIARRVKEARK